MEVAEHVFLSLLVHVSYSSIHIHLLMVRKTEMEPGQPRRPREAENGGDNGFPFARLVR
jgi:hypothetical protein